MGSVMASSSCAQEVLEEHASCAGVGIGLTPPHGLDGRVALVVQLEREADHRERRGEAAHALRLGTVLAAKVERKPDHKSAPLLAARDLRDPLDVGGEPARAAKGR